MTRSKKTVALVGANGMLARAVLGKAQETWSVTGYDLPDFDITDRSQVLSTFTMARPDLIVNCAAFTDVDGCEAHETQAVRVNGYGPGYLAEAALECSATLVHISTDYVFAGDGSKPYGEHDRPAPLSSYGRSKLLGEETIQATGLRQFYIIRTSWLYGAGGRSFVQKVVSLGRKRDTLRMIDDQTGSPTYTVDLAAAIGFLVNASVGDSDGPAHRSYGIYHFANAGRCSWYQFALEILEQAKLSGESIVTRQVVPVKTEQYPLPARRPVFSVLSCEKYRHVTGREIPHWQDSLALYFRQRS